MNIKYIKDVKDYKNFLDVEDETYLFTKDLTHRGIFVLDEMLQTNDKIYIGKMTRHVKDNWFNYYISGKEAPEINEYQWKNVKFRSYEALLGDKDYTEEQIVDALAYIYINFPGTYGSFPKSPSSIVEKGLNVTKYMTCFDKDVIQFSHDAFQPGAVHILPQNINKVMEYETHLDIHQAYAHIMKTKKFPVSNPVYVDLWDTENPDYENKKNDLLNNLGIYHIIDGVIRLKPNGFPLLQQNKKQKAASLSKWTKETMAFSDYNKTYRIADTYGGLYLTTPAYQVLLENYNIIEPLDIAEGYAWTGIKEGLGTEFINKLYDLRKTTDNPALKSFAKLCNEYCAGMFQRKFIISENPWIDLDGNKQDKQVKRQPLNCVIGDFITDYLRLEISHLLQKIPHDWVIGYDTDGIFLNQEKDTIYSFLEQNNSLDILGDETGKCHFDGIYKNVIHPANKQYYGYTIDGEVFGKLAGVNDGTEVAKQLLSGVAEEDITTVTYTWNKETKDYELTASKAKIGGHDND